MDKKRIIIILLFITVFVISIITSFFYYDDKVSINFETGNDEVFLTKYVKKNGKIEEPIKPIRDGYVFIEWQLNGETFDFNTQISDDIILTAKWKKEEYITITFVTNSDNEIKSNKILKGSIASELPEPTKENYEFIGWFLDEKLYDYQEINHDITLVAHYKNDKYNTTYKIGDTVQIVDYYASSAYSKKAFNKRAIGWKRKIINIIYDGDFPYVVGNEYGYTGFFKASAIEIIGGE